MKKEKILTKKNEVTFTTSDPNKMRGHFLAENLVRGWKEEFIDDDTGEVVEIERNEFIKERGEFVEGDVLSSILFHLEAGDIKEVKVSNQQRIGVSGRSSGTVWNAKVDLGKKKLNIILLAHSIEMALDIVKDYVELNNQGVFIIKSIKEYKSAIVIENNIEGEEEDGEFYEIEVIVEKEKEVIQHSTFITLTKNAETAKVVVTDWILKNKREDEVAEDLTITLETAKKIPINNTIDKDFSLAYINEEK